MMKRLQIVPALALLVGSVFVATAESLVVDPANSSIKVAVSATMDSFVGVLEKYDATIDVQPPSELPAKADVKFDFKDLKTGNVKRDKAMLEWMTYTNNPSASFHLTNWKQDGTNTVATGDFTLHGVKQTIAMPVQVKHAGTNWTITGTALINHIEYGLPKIRKMAVLTVDPKLKVSFELHLKPAAEPAKK